MRRGEDVARRGLPATKQRFIFQGAARCLSVSGAAFARWQRPWGVTARDDVFVELAVASAATQLTVSTRRGFGRDAADSNYEFAVALAGKLMSVELALAMAATRYMLSSPLHTAMPVVQLAAALLWLTRWATRHFCLTTTRPLRVMQPAAATCLRGEEGGDCAPYLSVWVRLTNVKCQMSNDKYQLSTK